MNACHVYNVCACIRVCKCMNMCIYDMHVCVVHMNM